MEAFETGNGCHHKEGKRNWSFLTTTKAVACHHHLKNSIARIGRNQLEIGAKSRRGVCFQEGAT